VERHGDDGGAQRAEDVPELADAIGVGASAAAGVDGVGHLEDIAPIQVPGAVMWLTDNPSVSTSLATSTVSGRRLSAPGREITARFL